MKQIDTSGFPWERIVEAIFPINDGSMTRLLEHCFYGSAQVQILFQSMHSLERRLADLRLSKDQLVIKRRVLLQQAETDKNLLFAAAWIAPAILSASMLRRI